MSTCFAIIQVRAYQNFDPLEESIVFEGAYQFDVSQSAHDFFTIGQPVTVYKYLDPIEEYTGVIVTKGTWDGGPYYLGIEFDSPSASFTIGATEDPYTTVCGDEVSSSSSSTSSTSSSRSTESSSSSNSYANNKDINDIKIIQGLNNLIPWTLYVESGFEGQIEDSNTLLNFSIDETKETLFSVDDLINNRNFTYSNSNPTNNIFVPEDEKSRYQHKDEAYVEVFSQDKSGLKEASIRKTESIYEYENFSSYIVPKFSWNFNTNKRPAKNDSNQTENIDKLGTIWVGTNNSLVKIHYNLEKAIQFFSTSLASETYNITHDGKTNNLFISTNDFIYHFEANTFINQEDQEEFELYSVNTFENENKSIVQRYEDGNDILCALRSYEGEFAKLYISSLEEQKVFGGLDAPQKLFYSKKHGAYIVSGTHVIWTVDNVKITSIYKVISYKIKDIAIASNGMICILLSGIGNIGDKIRILDADLSTIYVSEDTAGHYVKFCKNTNDFFYILSEPIEKSSENFDKYVSRHHLFDMKSKIFTYYDNVSELKSTAQSPESEAALSKIEISFPNGGEFLKKGEIYDINWNSSESTALPVKIDLYKDEDIVFTINSSTPNTGVYSWLVPDILDIGTTYSICITLLSSGNNEENVTCSSTSFNIVDVIPVSDVEIQPANYDNAADIVYNTEYNHIVVVLGDGNILIFDIDSKEFYGLLDTGLGGIRKAAYVDDKLYLNKNNRKIRVFVGSSPRLSDKWDSGIIETNLTSIYYGGGNNLEKGQKYYVNIQTETEAGEWTQVQSQEFIMPI